MSLNTHPPTRTHACTQDPSSGNQSIIVVLRGLQLFFYPDFVMALQQFAERGKYVPQTPPPQPQVRKVFVSLCPCRCGVCLPRAAQFLPFLSSPCVHVMTTCACAWCLVCVRALVGMVLALPGQWRFTSLREGGWGLFFYPDFVMALRQFAERGKYVPETPPPRPQVSSVLFVFCFGCCVGLHVRVANCFPSTAPFSIPRKASPRRTSHRC